LKERLLSVIEMTEWWAVCYEDVGERRNARPDLGGLVFGCGFFGGGIPWSVCGGIGIPRNRV
jgi:hypothetical protein